MVKRKVGKATHKNRHQRRRAVKSHRGDGRGEGRGQAIEPIKLNIGGATGPELPGYIIVDRKTGGEAFPLSRRRNEVVDVTAYNNKQWQRDPTRIVFGNESVDEVRASHILEHFPTHEAPKVLAEWVRVLKPGGTLKIAVPDLDKLIDAASAGNPGNWPIQSYIYGGQVDENDYHKSSYNDEWLRHLMAQAGLVDIRPWVSEVRDCASLPVSLNLMGTKPTAQQSLPRPEIPKTASVMTLPRLAWTCNMFSALEVAVARRLEFDKVEGVFWDQCLTRALEAHLNNGTEWILVSDYDSVYGIEQFDALCHLMLKYPDAGAICPVQIKRDDGTPLFVPLDGEGKPFPAGARVTTEHFEPEVVRAAWGHFGLTILRVDALRKMSKPWFVSKPAPDGSWGEGRVDPDIGFWKNFVDSGNKLYIATHVPLLHAQVVYTAPDQQLQARHIYPKDLNKRQLPEWVRR